MPADNFAAMGALVRAEATWQVTSPALFVNTFTPQVLDAEPVPAIGRLLQHPRTRLGRTGST